MQVRDRFINGKMPLLTRFAFRNPVNTSEYVDELDKIGHFDSMEMSQIMDGNFYYIHRSCATWSSGISRDSSGALGKVAYVVSQSLRRKCAYCNHFGASVACKVIFTRCVYLMESLHRMLCILPDGLSKILSFSLCSGIRRISNHSNIRFIL